MRNLVQASADQAFHLVNGSNLYNLQDLVDALPTMEEAVFAHHVNSQRNDFARWIHDILDDEELAAKIWKFKSKAQITKLVKSHLKKNYV